METATAKLRIDAFTMKMQLYPTPAQAEKIDKIFRALQIAYNITFHEVFMLNPQVCKAPDANGMIWPDFKTMAQKEWKAELIRRNPAVKEAPAASITTNNGLFLLDAKKAWEMGMHNRPIQKANRKDFRFYNDNKPRRSFMVQMDPKKLVPSSDNPKVAWLTIPGIPGQVKARGFNRKLWFGEDGLLTYEEALSSQQIANALTTRVTKDACGAYFVCLTFSSGKSGHRKLYQEAHAREESMPLGMDVGVKDIAILSDGTKFKNQHYKMQKKQALKKMSRKLSRRWGPANPAFRDYAKAVRAENRSRSESERLPLPSPSNGYKKIQHDHAMLERKISRRRSDYYHKATDQIVRRASTVAVETLRVKNMLQNHRLAFALADAAMNDFTMKLKYKANRRGINFIYIRDNEPSSQLCSVCGYKNPEVKNLKVRNWTCPCCGSIHDRDINAARNILQIALERGIDVDPEKPSSPKASDCNQREPSAQQMNHRRKPRDTVIWEEDPNIIIQFSEQLTGINDPRYVVVNKRTNQIIDDGQGVGYRSVVKARNCFKAKKKWSLKIQNQKQ